MLGMPNMCMRLAVSLPEPIARTFVVKDMLVAAHTPSLHLLAFQNGVLPRWQPGRFLVYTSTSVKSHRVFPAKCQSQSKGPVTPHSFMFDFASGCDAVVAPAELRFEDAMRILPQCSLSLFQPMELFPLFPSITAPWADQLPRKGYWGMHRPLQPLDALLAGEAQPQTRTLLEQEAMQSIAEYLLEVSHLYIVASVTRDSP